MLAYSGTVERSNADSDRRINSVSVNVLTKGQGGAILVMEDTNLHELKKIENVTNRVVILWLSGRISDSRSQIPKGGGKHVRNRHLLLESYSRRQAQLSRTQEKMSRSPIGSEKRRCELSF